MAKNKGLESLMEFITELAPNIDKRIKNRELKRMGNEYKDAVQFRTEQGVGVKSGKMKDFKRLKPNTIKSRTEKGKKGQLSSKTTPPTSNQIETGEMVDNITATINQSKNNIVIEPPNNRANIAAYQEDMGRTIFSPTKQDADWFEQEVEKIVEEEVANLVNKIK